MLAAQQQEEIEARIQQEAEALAQQKLQEQQAAAVAQQTQQKTSLKQQARIIEQDRGQKIVFDEQPKSEFGETHVSQIKSETSNSSRVSDIVKNMEREREIEMANIKKQIGGPI